MTAAKVIEYFRRQYPGKNIVALPQDDPTEIICEVDPSMTHPDFNVAIAAVKQSTPHYHRKSVEIYEVIEGDIELIVDDQTHTLHAGDVYTIQPGCVHSAKGNFALVRVTSRPGWTPEDHVLA